MNTINKQQITEIEIKKSVFIATLVPVSSLDEVDNALKQIRKKYYDATHNCYSYILGDNGSTYKYSDDGEPGGTAGIVIYNSLSKNNLTNVLCVVTRYFGGIKLGACGLVRAYANASSEVINASDVFEIIEYGSLKISFNYTYTTQILKLMNNEEKLSQDYSDKVTLEYKIPINKIDDYKCQLIELTNGNIKIY